ncbi:MAG TPA: hypothetical protein VGQ57_12745 [Polyangiaceae bacterium]|jgi:hypothetical protein|nr:hypothetical protein [Polyangiaceae bacterium]
MIQKSGSGYAIWIKSALAGRDQSGGVKMERLWSFWCLLAFGGGILLGWALERQRSRQARRETLRPGAFVLVNTGDGKRVVARVLSRGVSHYWIELPPGGARWWVPVAAVEPAPRRVVRQAPAFKRPLPTR